MKPPPLQRTIALFAMGLCLIITNAGNARTQNTLPADTSSTSSFKNAVVFLDKLEKLEPSPYWPHIQPALFLQNLKTNIRQPLSPYQGRGTNFCGYGAFTYLLLKDDPLGYVQLLLQLYQKGRAEYAGIMFNPSNPVRVAAGNLKFKGILDIRPAEQMWYLCLADHFKGYLNIFNRQYDPGDEDLFWASVNYAKFNRMLQKMLHFKVQAKGGDIIRPHTGDLFGYITQKLATGQVILFINNRLVHKKNHTKLKLGVPTHFIVLDEITKTGNTITLTYWDYGGKTLMQLTPAFLKKITFGITHCTKKREADAS